MVITLDGPAGVGKSSLARELAARLGLPFMDSGAMFRCAALALGPETEQLQGQALETHLQERLESLHFSLRGSGGQSELLCNGKALGQEIRSEEVSALTSRLAALPPVREALKKAQQRLGGEIPLVAEGRDMGTVIFPQAACKFFLDAEPRVRARRRQLQLHEKDRQIGQGEATAQSGEAAASVLPTLPEALTSAELRELDEIEAQIRKRDDQDRNRALAPLRPATDAILVDTSRLSLEEVLEKLLTLYFTKVGAVNSY
ncbi:MAG: (d)CMP kinase [Deltaproteobacteria bacterium]|jgi:cytidylate kinase|nr:(d)CMP kinase [Deltaproteobacteria bacterium]